MRFIVIGGNPAGLSAASAVRKGHPDWEIIVYEMAQYVSYGSCGLPYYVSGLVENRDQLITLTPEVLMKKRNIPVKLWHEVISVDFEKKQVRVKDVQNNKKFDDNYDVLMIATGGKPKSKAKINAGLEIEHSRIFRVHTIADADNIINTLKEQNPKSGILIGSGYIGLEMLEAYADMGIADLTLVGPRLVFRTESQKFIRKELEKHGIKLHIGKYVKSLKPLSDEKIRITLEDETMLDADFVQIAIGVAPNTDIFKDTALKMMNGAIIVDEYMRTNIEGVYSAGDCATAYHRITKKNIYLPLAPGANKQGRIAGTMIAGKNPAPFPGVVGTAVWKVFDLYCGKTGIGVEEARNLGYNAASILIENNEIAHYYPNKPGVFKQKMSVLLTFDIDSHELLGGEITAPSALGAKKIDVIATALYGHFKIEDLQSLDLSYAPPFAPVWDPILIAANIARKKCK